VTRAAARYLLCRVGSRLGAIAVEHVTETLRPLPVEPMAGAPPFVLGLAIIRGAAVPVVDAARLLLVPDADPLPLNSSTSQSTASGAARRWIGLQLGGRRAALAVDAVVDVCLLPAALLAQIPPLLREASAERVQAIGTLDAQLLMVLEAARLVPESVWESLQAQVNAQAQSASA
jgi:purine-binding chemotaxis protein CheW